MITSNYSEAGQLFFDQKSKKQEWTQYTLSLFAQFLKIWYGGMCFFFLDRFFFVQIESKTFRQFSNNVVHLKVDTKWHNISVTQFFCESSEKLIQIKEGFKSENLTKL